MLVRVAEPGRPAFQLRKGEAGISVFNSEAVAHPLATDEVLNYFREGSQAVLRSVVEIEAKGLRVLPVPGAEPLPQRHRESHAEIRPGLAMTRPEFKQALKELE